MPKELIEIHLTGENIIPGSVRSKELAELIASTEEMIASVVVRDHPELSKDEVIVGLVEIADGSVSLRFKTPLPNEALPAFIEIAQSVNTGQYESLPPGSIESLQTMTSFTRRHNSDLVFASVTSPDVALATVTPETVVTAQPELTGSSVIYGRLVRVGGRVPTAMVTMAGGSTVYCRLGEKNGYEVARTLGQRLYTWVGLEGEAKWSAWDNSLISFRVDRVLDFDDTPVDEAMKNLASIVGEHIDRIGDVTEYIAEIRGGHEIA